MTDPLVSIIIPTFNRAHLIGETLDSVLGQTYQNWECIVVDDGSTDATDELLSEYCNRDTRFQYYHRAKSFKAGGNGARNYGLELSKGEYIQWFDSDDLMMPNKIELSYTEMITKNNELVISNFHFLGQKEKIQKIELNNLLSYHLAYKAINTPMCFFKRSILRDYKFNEALVRGQEFEFFMRLFANENIKFSILQESLSVIRLHNNSITGNYMKGNENSISSSLYTKLSALKLSVNLDNKTQEIVVKQFEIALWKALIFRHKKLYWEYLKLYFNQEKDMSLLKKINLSSLAWFYFTFNRGGQLIKRRFLAQ
ncbi:glycosyltransferase family 2 protein [Winogradskyella undariae]|uniref:glycosyltransferase family 2 protein n=1 Tax=Winogradskyella undariae TaxID=1285465 RepID=UPI0015CD5B59|nr:glycosyltransferase family 2 protein [Winogradskyella undariae]